jgi:hypothetical protein
MPLMKTMIDGGKNSSGYNPFQTNRCWSIMGRKVIISLSKLAKRFKCPTEACSIFFLQDLPACIFGAEIVHCFQITFRLNAKCSTLAECIFPLVELRKLLELQMRK